MAIEITIPRLGWSMDEGTFVEWLKRDGAMVKSGDAIFSLESEKALQEVESVDEGILHIPADGPAEGDTVTVGTVIGYLLNKGEAPPPSSATQKQVASAEQPASAANTSSGSSEVSARNPMPSSATTTAHDNDRSHRHTISPRARRAARELGVDWQSLNGSGKTGRIRECDVRAAANSPAATAQATPRASGSVRHVIAKRMLQSAQSTAPVTLTARADATNLVSLRRQFKAAGHDAVAPAYHDIVLKIVAAALKRHPALASRWTDAGIIPADDIHIGIAVDTEAGLIVPVVRNVDRLSLRELAMQSRETIERALARKCSKAELEGGVFTVSNLGPFGIEFFTPIINTPETAILGLGAIQREAVVLRGDQVVPCDILPLSLTFDHRVTDGAPAARFLQSVREGIENPSAWLIE